jgi:hypothetical protein
VEGEPAGIAVDKCSDDEMHQMARDLRSLIANLLAIKMERHSKYAITNSTGGPCLDYRILHRLRPSRTFHSEIEFSESLRLKILPDLMHRTEYKVIFTHTYLKMRNNLVKDGRIFEIVD